MPNNLKAFVRSVFPFIESSAVAAIAHYVYNVSPTHSAEILSLGGVALSAFLHWAETHFPWVGVFLGWIGAPTYAPSAKQALTSHVVQLQEELAATLKELDAWKNARPATGTATLVTDATASQVA